MIDLKKIIHKILVRLNNTYTKTETNNLLNNKQNKITLSTEEPQNSQGVDGDIWIRYSND